MSGRKDRARQRSRPDGRFWERASRQLATQLGHWTVTMVLITGRLMTAGCDVCRPEAPADRKWAALVEVAVHPNGPEFLRRCQSCGTFWLETPHDLRALAADEAARRFPDVPSLRPDYRGPAKRKWFVSVAVAILGALLVFVALPSFIHMVTTFREPDFNRGQNGPDHVIVVVMLGLGSFLFISGSLAAIRRTIRPR